MLPADTLERDFISNLNANFRLEEIKIIWQGPVQKVGHANALKQRHLIISSAGIFLIRRRAFSFQSRIIREIPFCSLISLFVAGHSGSFSSKTVQIRIKSREIQKIASLVYFIRQAQIPSDVLAFNVSLPDEAMVPIKPEDSPYQPDSIFFDRLISAAFHYNILLSPELLSEITVPKTRSYTITKEIMSSILFPSLLMSLTFEQDVWSIKLQNINMAGFLNQAGTLFRYNRFVRTVVLEKIDFTGAGSVLDGMLRKAHALRPSEWIFIDCDLTNEEFEEFFEALCLIDKPITALVFKGCKFSEDMFRTIFQSIFFNDCFHSLECFHIEGIPFPGMTECAVELGCCSWALESKCLYKIVLSNCGVSAGKVINQYLQYDIGVREIDLAGSDLSQPLQPMKQVCFTDFGMLRFKRSSNVSLAFMRSLFDLLREHDMTVSVLDLSALQFEDPSQYDMFIDLLSETTINGLEMLSFDDNPMNSSQTLKFVKFLEGATSLKFLSVNRSIDISDSPIGLSAFLDCVAKMENLETLYIKSSGSMKFTFGKLMVPAIQNLKQIKTLDVSNQSLGAEGVEALIALSRDGNLTELFLEGCIGNSFTAICDLCESMMTTNLKVVSFPYQDLKRSLRILPSGEDIAALEERRDDLCRRFVAKFGKRCEEEMVVLGSRYKVKGDSRKVEKRQIPQAEGSSVILTNGFEDASKMSSEIDSLFKECVGNDVIDPMVSLIGTIQESLSFDSLLRQVS